MSPTVILLAILVLLLATALLAVGWYFSSQILVPTAYSLMPAFEVRAAGAGTVTLPAPPPAAPQFARTRATGVYNLLWEGGYGRLGDIIDDNGAELTRGLELTTGRSPRASDPARLDFAVFRRDPLRDHQLAFEDLRLEGEVGPLAAWWLRGGPSAVVLIHGRRRADLTETLRILPTLAGAGHSVLALSWRNHDTSAPSPDGLYRYGATEYRDVLTGLGFLARRGITRVVIYGYSTGATLGLQAARHWPDEAPELSGFVLDSPLIDPAAAIRTSARTKGVPDVLTSFALAVARFRTGVRWHELDQRRYASDFTVPFLIFGGVADGTIPIETVDDFAARLRAPVDYRRLAGVQHTEAWNVDPEAYESAVRSFVAEVLPAR